MLKFLKNNSGVTLIEYGLIAAMIAVVVVGGLSVIGTNLDTVFTTVSASV